jgi:hypothetical protein
MTGEATGYCGYRCDLCAAGSDDEDVRHRLVAGWRRIFGHQCYTAENVRCDGCRSGGRIADRSCRARPCAVERGVESCACCDDFPCDLVKPLMASREGLLIYCRPADGPVTREEYELCMRQFESMPVLLQKLAECGRIGTWASRGGQEGFGGDR